jgi:hypothetical protein
LHYDDIEILKKIAHNLGVGKVYMVGNRSAKYSVSAFQDIVSIILPIFNLYPLQTTKALDFADFSEAVKIVLNSKANGKRLRLTEAEILKIKNLKIGMNRNRVIGEDQLAILSNRVDINKFWVLGFTEGSILCFYLFVNRALPCFFCAQYKTTRYNNNLAK